MVNRVIDIMFFKVEIREIENIVNNEKVIGKNDEVQDFARCIILENPV